MPSVYSTTGKYFIIALLTFISFWSLAKRPEFQTEIKNHLFFPAEIEIPANTKVKLIIYNHDQTPEEFDSFDLNREKVIFPNKKSVIFIGPLPTGRYEFFGEFNPNSANGAIIVLPKDQFKTKTKTKTKTTIKSKTKNAKSLDSASAYPLKVNSEASHINNQVTLEVIYAN